MEKLLIKIHLQILIAFQAFYESGDLKNADNINSSIKFRMHKRDTTSYCHFLTTFIYLPLLSVNKNKLNTVYFYNMANKKNQNRPEIRKNEFKPRHLVN
jgi:hypothetical protein